MRSANHYIPILKGRLGEFNAVSRVDPGLADRYTPLIEFVPTGDELGEDGEPTLFGVEESVRKTGERLDKYWPRSTDVIVDLHALPSVPGYYPAPAFIDRCFQKDTTQVIPTCRPADADDSALIERLARSLDVFSDRNICIRLSDEDLDERDEPIADSLGRLISGLETSRENVDLVIDFGAITEDSVSFAARIARLVIVDLPYLDAWKSLTLAAGGFPINLDGVGAQTVTELRRWELTMWRTLRDRLRDKLRVPAFGDYAIAYPRQLAGVAFAPAPQIRYTTPEGWAILKGRKNNRRGNAQFLDICQAITEHPAFTPGLSWGDEQIAANARFANQDPVPEGARPGNAMVWRAIGTSHHLAQVISRLATEGEP